MEPSASVGTAGRDAKFKRAVLNRWVLGGLCFHLAGLLVTLFMFDWTPPRVWDATEYRAVLTQHAYVVGSLSLIGLLLSVLYWMCTGGLTGSAQGSDHVAHVISCWLVAGLIPAFFFALFWWWAGLTPPLFRGKLVGGYLGIFAIWFFSACQTICSVGLAFGIRDRPVRPNLLSKLVRRILPG